MHRTDSLERHVSSTWKYALVGGIISIPLTVGLHWLSGTGNELSLNMVALGGLIAGFLGNRKETDADGSAAGLRAGIVGVLPGFWLFADFFEAVTALSGPLWFRSGAIVLTIGTVTAIIFGLGALLGLLGAKVGSWLTERDGVQQSPFVEKG